MVTSTSERMTLPIFIHSLFRSGSTYLFKTFRRSSAGYWCYQEPLHEIAFFCREDPSRLQEDHGEAKIQLLRHPRLEGAYFAELAETWPAWKDAVSEEIIYNAYFSDPDVDIGIDYWKSLAQTAKGRPVFQECRTSGRIGAIKSQMGGKHIYLWRNPWDQWWSFKVTPYFDVANQLIVHARRAPEPVLRMLAELQLPYYEQGDLAGSFAFYNEQVVTSEQSYLVFYLLWCLALREGAAHADVMLNIDRLSDSVEYRSDRLARLKDAGIEGIDFSDCHAPQGQYLERDRKFFEALEERVHQWLRQGGWSQEEIDQVQGKRHEYQPASWSTPTNPIAPADFAEQASRARELAIRFETSLAERARSAAIQLSDLQSRAQAAQASIHQAEARAQQVEQREAQARAQLQQALEVSREAHQLSHQAEARAEAHQQQASAYQSQLQLAEERIDDLGGSSHHWWQQAQQSQTRIDELGGSSHHWWQQACALEAERNALRQSASWRITAPLRVVAGLALHPLRAVRMGANRVVHRTIVISERPLSRLMAAVLRRPELSHRINLWLLRYPALYQQLLGVARRGEILPGTPENLTQLLGREVSAAGIVENETNNLTPRARKIYSDLEAAIEKNTRKNNAHRH